MTVYGINSTSKDPTYTWADVTPTVHRKHDYLVIAEELWKIGSILVDKVIESGATGEVDWTEVNEAYELAKRFEDMVHYQDDECTCLPNSVLACRVCRAFLDYTGFIHDHHSILKELK